MDGDIAPLDKIIQLAKKYCALTMVDDAHAIGVLGKTGGGTAEHYGLEGEIDVNMGTMSKGLGCAGGFVSGSKDLIDYLRVACRSYVFSDSLAPPLAASVIEIINIIKNQPDLRTKLHQNSDYFRDGMHEIGLDTLSSVTQIVPWLIGSEQKTMAIAELLFQEGIFAPAIRWPAVPKNKARIRFNMMATHTQNQIDTLLTLCKDIGRRLKLI
jgi:glycine C-acetyltransferase/8-amino-7-oxononanoate synthase